MKQKPIVAEYEIIEVPFVRDGDTLWVRRRRVVGDVEGMSLISEDYAGGVAVRLDDGLQGVNTPEKRKDPAGWEEARLDLQSLVDTLWTRGDPNPILRVYDLSGVFGRILGDIIPASGMSLTKYQRDINAWPAYK